MAYFYKVVPWFDTKEWFHVYNNLFSETPHNREDALKSLLIWKARCPSLPSGIESTLSLLEVNVRDSNSVDKTDDDQLLRLAYSSAIMRFVNHMFDADTAKGNSLYRVAQNRGVPDWIVDLRHDTAHSNNLPSLELLREATLICLQWLHENYWIMHKEIINDCVINKSDMLKTLPDENITVLINFCITLSFCSHSNCSIKNLAKMPRDMQQSLISDATELFGDKVNFSNLKKVSVLALFNHLNLYSKTFLKNINKDQINKVLLDKESLFLSTDICAVMSRNRNNKVLGKQYVKCFAAFLNFLHIHDILEDFTLELIKITELNGIDDKRSKLAAQWVSEILKALRKIQLFSEKITEKKLDIEYKGNKELISLFNHWFPNEKSCPLLLDLSKPVPSRLTDMNVIRPIISTYNPNLSYFINDLLHLVKPKLPNSIIIKICKLSEVISSPERFPVQSTKIYTVEDLSTNDIKGKTEVSDDCLIVNESEELYETGFWKKASISHAWASCPIGLLPWQRSQLSAMEIE